MNGNETDAMKESSDGKITLYTSKWCAHSMSVKGFLARNSISVNSIDVDGNPEAREELMQLNGGYASVPTLVFPDGTQLTEPSLAELRHKLELEPPQGLTKRLLSLLGRRDETGA